MSTDSGNLKADYLNRHFSQSHYVLNGATMGTRYVAEFYAPPGLDKQAIQTKLQRAVDQVDRQMSPWIINSDLNRLNQTVQGKWLLVPDELCRVLCKGLEIGELSDGAFDMNVGTLLKQWGFGPQGAEADHGQRPTETASAHLAINVDASTCMIRKQAEVTLDLCGIAKGFGVDELARVLDREGINNYLVSIDGELRVSGEKPDNELWALSIERPDLDQRQILITFHGTDIALATSGDYRQRRFRNGRFVSHTMDSHTNAPLENDLASVTVAASNCMSADAWATALLVKGLEAGIAMANKHRLDAVFVQRKNSDFRCFGTGGFCDPELESHFIQR